MVDQEQINELKELLKTGKIDDVQFYELIRDLLKYLEVE